MLASLNLASAAGSSPLAAILFWTFLLLCIGGIVGLGVIIACQTDVVCVCSLSDTCTE